jgi:Zn-dependent protease/CBS domain-containing protein
MTRAEPRRNEPGASVLVGRIAGVPIFLHGSWFAGCALVAALAASSLPAQARGHASAVAREAGTALLLFHALFVLPAAARLALARMKRLPFSCLVVTVVGVLLGAEASDAATEILLAAAGSVVSLTTSWFFWALGILELSSPWRTGLLDVALVNLALAVCGLLPVGPLDGVRLLHGALWARLGRLEAKRLVPLVSQRAAVVLGGLALALFVLRQPVWALGLLAVAAAFEASSRRARAGSAPASSLDERLVEAAIAQGAVATVRADISLLEARRSLDFDADLAIPVTRGSLVVGLLFRSDLARCPASEDATTSVQAAMSALSPGFVIDPGETLRTACQRIHNRAGYLLVLREGRLHGLVTRRSIERCLARLPGEGEGAPEAAG